VAWEILDPRGTLLRGGRWQGELPENRAAKLTDIDALLPRLPEGIFFARITVSGVGGTVLSRNLYLFSQLTEHPFSPLLTMDRAVLDIRRKGERRYSVENTGGVVALFVQALEPTGRSWVYADRNFDSLFPGERAEYVVTPIHATRGPEAPAPELRWEWLNMAR
jgi:hypothetical protein